MFSLTSAAISPKAIKLSPPNTSKLLEVSYRVHWCKARLHGTSYSGFSHADSQQRANPFFKCAEAVPYTHQSLFS